MERKIVKKWFWVWEFDKEEQWLNTMAQQGWVLDKVGFCRYEFIPCQPGEYTVRLEMRSHDEAYLGFMADTGAEYMGRMMKWIYFRRKTELGQFELFSDIDSRIAYLDKMCRTLRGVGIANLLIGVGNTLTIAHPVSMVNLLAATLLMYALGRVEGKKEALKKDRLLME